MRNRIFTAALLLGLGTQAAELAAQRGTELHLYAGAALPRSDWSTFGTGTGWGYGANIVGRPLSFLGIYGGWDRFRHSMDRSSSPEIDEIRFIDTGFRAGIELRAPLPFAAPFVSGGLTLGEGNLEVVEGEVTSRYGRNTAVGFEASAGLDIDVGLVVGIRPRVGYRTKKSDIGQFLDPTGPRDIRIDHLSITLGIALIP